MKLRERENAKRIYELPKRECGCEPTHLEPERRADYPVSAILEKRPKMKMKKERNANCEGKTQRREFHGERTRHTYPCFLLFTVPWGFIPPSQTTDLWN